MPLCVHKSTNLQDSSSRSNTIGVYMQTLGSGLHVQCILLHAIKLTKATTHDGRFYLYL